MQTKYLITLGCIAVTFSSQLSALPLSPRDEPKADSFYICYEKRCPNNVERTPTYKYTRFKYIGCVISRLPCHLYCCDSSKDRAVKPLRQFQWVNNYPDALNSFYRCAYS